MVLKSEYPGGFCAQIVPVNTHGILLNSIKNDLTLIGFPSTIKKIKMKENRLKQMPIQITPTVFLQNPCQCKKMVNIMQPYEMNDDQRRIYIDAAQLHEAYMDAFTYFKRDFHNIV